jgi:hypothetical protein
MVAVDGFPGPLYPPDDPQHRASPDSDFVLALKRTAARLGAWPWDPPSWDNAYSNRFAHGDGYDDPDHAGIQALQRWSGTITPTGNVGQATFNFLRSVLVPQGRTHAGEPAMDSVAVNQINAAYADANPPPTPVPKHTVRQLAYAVALSQIGYKESPAGSNKNKYGSWYGANGQPWCAMFCTWCYDGPENAGPDSPTFNRTNHRYAYVPYIVSDARNGRYGLSVTGSPIPGDLVCYDWERNGDYDHVGLFEDWTGGHTFTAVEGNTSVSNNSNGGEVMRRQRDAEAQGTVFIRVAEPAPNSNTASAPAGALAAGAA